MVVMHRIARRITNRPKQLNQAIIERFRAARIDIPFPQREIRLLDQPT
jgi:small-conductance mechanosensitive channel